MHAIPYTIRFWAILLCLWCLVGNGYGQKQLAGSPYIRKISYQEGLPASVIYDLFIDRDGFMYMGTDKGLYRYNGHTFVKVAMKGGYTSSVNNIAQTQEGVLVCKNFSNQIFVMQSDTLQVLPGITGLVEKEGNIREFAVRNNQLWLAMYQALCVYDLKTAQVRKIIGSAHEITDVTFDSLQQMVLFATPKQFLKFNGTRIYTLASFNGGKKLFNYQGKTYIVQSDQEQHIFVYNGLQVTPLPGPKGVYYHYFRSTSHGLWLCTSSGLFPILVNAKGYTRPLLRNQRISDVIEDMDGNLWISTLDNGLFMIPSLQLYQIKEALEFKDGEQSYTRLMALPNQEVLVGSNQGNLYQLYPDGTLKSSFLSEYKAEIEFMYYDTVSRTVFHSQGQLRERPAPQIEYLKHLKSMMRDGHGNYVIGNYSLAGLIAQDLKGLPRVPWLTDTPVLNTQLGDKLPMYVFDKKRCRAVFYSALYDQYYLAFSDGLKIVRANGTVSIPRDQTGKPIIALDLKPDFRGAIWVASALGGVHEVRDTQVVQSFTTVHGLSSNQCLRLAIDTTQVWVITAEGLDALDIQQKRIRSISSGLGLKGMQLNDVMILNNTVWLATHEGVLYFPVSITAQFLAPRFFFRRALVKGAPTQNTQFEHTQNDISFEFDMHHYKTQGSLHYSYRLMGYDTTWQILSANNQSVNYLSLPPGEYIFQIKGNANQMETPVYAYAFQIKLPFWLTWWFIAGASLVVLYGLWVGYRWVVQRTRNQQIIREKLVLSQLTALRAQMNPHFLFNILSAVQGLIYANKKTDATSYLGKFSDLMRKILETSDKQTINLAKELEILNLYLTLEASRFESDFAFHIHIDDYVMVDEIQIPSMILQPFVENAIKHGLLHKKGSKNLKVSIYWEPNERRTLVIEVDDNGIGREASAAINLKRPHHRSFATRAIDSRIQLLNKSFLKPIRIQYVDKLRNGIATGTLVKIFIPIHND